MADCSLHASRKRPSPPDWHGVRRVSGRFRDTVQCLDASGLDAYRRIAAGAKPLMSPGARLMAEIGPAQGAEVRAILGAAGLGEARILPDLDGRDRVVVVSRPQRSA